LKVNPGNTVHAFSTFRWLGILVVIFFLAHTSYAQNTKGDKPSSSREGRFKLGQKKDRNRAGKSKRIKSKGRSVANSGAGYTPRRRSRGGERAGRPLKPVFSVKDPSDKQRAWKGDITGRRIRHKNASSATPNVHRQTGKDVRRTLPNREGRQNVTAGRPVRIPSATGKIRNVFPQTGKFVHNPSRQPRETQRPVSNRSTLARLKTLETRKPPPGKKVRVVPRTASRAFIRHKSINVYANFRRPKKKGERATTRDLAGMRLRTKNYQTPSPGLIKAPKTYSGKRRVGDRPYKGPAGYYKSVSGKQKGAWIGDITNRNLRHRNRSSKKSVEGIPGIFRGNRSATRTGAVGIGGRRPPSSLPRNKVGVPVPVRAPGIGAIGVATYKGNRRGLRGFLNQGEQFSGFIKSKRRAKTDVSGFPGKRRLFENRPGFANQGESYTGSIKSRRAAKGGGSISGRLWNNRGSAVPVKIGKTNVGGYPGKMKLFQNRPGFRDQGEEFSGAIKRKRPIKGGGSVSGKIWNNNESAVEGKAPGQQKGLNFSGNIKARRPVKGGGSVSGKLWNNNETPVEGKLPAQQKGLNFSGNIKARRPAKAKGDALPVKVPPANARKIDGYPGKLKRFETQPGFADQGEEFTGYIRLSRLKKNYVQNKLAHDESLKKKKPEKNVYGVEGLQVKVQRRDYVKNKNSADDALLVQKNTATDKAVGGLQVRVKQYDYKRNPSSSDAALKVREPGKAFARANDYQGNIKMQRIKLFEKNRNLHPDARFVKTNKNNVQEERDTLTNLKLWWARLFKKQENQPDHLKEKGKKPRYDKGEQGMWYD
jgi:hypothetical protein